MNILYQLRRAINYLQGKKQPFETVRCEEINGEPLVAKLYILGAVNDWGLVLVCPCGCEQHIELNLLPETRPRWRIERHWDSTLTVDPSVWRTEGCRSHFWIRRGVIQWVRN